MRQRRPKWGMLTILALYLAIGGTYSVVVPVFEAPDESHHFFVIKHIVEKRALPVQREEVRGPWRQEGSQPPLYYLVGALVVGGIDLADAEGLLWRNPQANIGDPNNPGNKNVYIHPPAQDYPWSGAVLAVHLLRVFSLLLGAATIYVSWRMLALTLPGRPAIALSTTAVMAFIPQFLFVGSSVNNDNAMTFLSVLSLYLLLRELRASTHAEASRASYWARWVGLGTVLGLSLLTKLSALALLVLASAVIVLVAWYRRSWAALWEAAIAVGVPVLAIAGWWYARNIVLYGEPTGLTAMWEVVGRRTDFGQDLWGEFRGLRYSFWGLFGWFSIGMPGWIYRTLDVCSLLAVAGIALSVGRWISIGLWRGAWSSWRYREPEWGAAYRPLAYLVMAGWLGMVFVSLVRWTSLTKGSQGRLLFPAAAPVALFLVMGLRAWFSERWETRDLASGGLALAMFCLGGAAPWLWIASAYARPPEVMHLPEDAVPMDLAFGDGIILRGVGFEQETVNPGEPFKVNLYWEGTRPFHADEEVVVWLRMIDGHGSGVGLEDAYPGAGTWPVSLWPVGSMLAGRQYVLVGEDAPAPMVARLDLGLYYAGSGDRLPSPGSTLPTIGRVKVVPRRWPKANKGEPVARFERGVSLAGYDHGGEVRAGEALPVLLTWSVQDRPGSDYTVFVHLAGEGGEVIAYGDGPPRDGLYPTYAWDRGEVVEDQHLMPVAGDSPPGLYRVKVGLYNAGGRVAAYGPNGDRLRDDAVGLGWVEVN